VSFFPVTAPLAMPNRVAMGAAAWWEPPVAAALTVAAIACLVWFGGRVYSRAVLHTGAMLKLRDVWTRDAPSATNRDAVERPVAPTAAHAPHRWTTAAVLLGAVVLAGIVGLVTSDVIIGIAVGAATYAIASRVVRSHPAPRDLHPSHH
jgi:hypothetical protein